MQTGIDNSEGLHLSKPLPKPYWKDEAAGGINPPDLPIDLAPDNCMATHLVDIVCNVELPDKQDIETKVNAGRWSDLPVPFCLKQDLEIDILIQFALVPQADDKHCLIKHLFTKGCKLNKS